MDYHIPQFCPMDNTQGAQLGYVVRRGLPRGTTRACASYILYMFLIILNKTCFMYAS